MNGKVYYDHAATTKQLPSVTKAMNDAIENNWYNISSAYTPSFEARKIYSSAQENAGKLINAKGDRIVFTSGATEANNMVLKGVVSACKKANPHIITSCIEHPAVFETLKVLEKEGVSVTYLPVKSNGQIDVRKLEESIRPDTVLISIMYVNNETGVIQPIEEVSRIASERKILFHTDAVQALGHIDIDVEKLSIDFLSASAHKMYGPKGVGFLFVKDFKSLSPLMEGGGQQKNMRSGTLNNEGLAGFSQALSWANSNMKEENERLKEIRDFMENRLCKDLPDTEVNGDLTERIPTTMNLSFKGIEAESLIMMLDMKGILVSGGSACATGSGEPSRVLTNMGLSFERAKGSIRFSLGIDNTMEEAKKSVDIIIETIKYLQSIRL